MPNVPVARKKGAHLLRGSQKAVRDVHRAIKPTERALIQPRRSIAAMMRQKNEATAHGESAAYGEPDSGSSAIYEQSNVHSEAARATIV
jgi:hypothetical protein